MKDAWNHLRRPLFLPAILERRSAWFDQLATSLASGMSASTALRVVGRRRGGSALLKAAAQVDRDGGSLVESLLVHSPPAVDYEADLLSAAEDGGRLPEALRDVAGSFRTTARLRRRLMGGCAYPLLLAWLALFVAALVGRLASGTAPAEALRDASGVAILAPLVGVAALGVVRWGIRIGGFSGLVQKLWDRVPFLGSARRAFATVRLALTLRIALQAGLLVTEAWRRAGRASGREDWIATIEEWGPQWEAGAPPGELLELSDRFPDEFVSAYRVGEINGGLDEALARVELVFQEAGSRTMDRFVEWLPRVVYAVIAGAITLGILAAGAAYANWISRLAQ